MWLTPGCVEEDGSGKGHGLVGSHDGRSACKRRDVMALPSIFLQILREAVGCGGGLAGEDRSGEACRSRRQFSRGGEDEPPGPRHG